MGYDIQQQSTTWRLPVEWKAPSDWLPRVTVIESTRIHRRMGYGGWLRARPVTLLAEMPLTQVREQRMVCFRGGRQHKLY